MASRPTLVLISGAPGAGKTVLVQRLADELPVVVIEKDAIKESLFDTLGEGDREWSMKLGAAAFALVRVLIQSHFRANQSMIVEGAFQPEFDTEWLDRFKQQFDFDILELHCYTDMDTALRRYRRRQASQERHSGHISGMNMEDHMSALRDRFHTYGPLTSGSGLVSIDTTDFAAVDYAAIVGRVRASIGHRPLI